MGARRSTYSEDLMTVDEPTRWLQDANTSVKRNSFYMKKALDEDNLREALRYSAALLGELRTSLLTPQPYYELYMQATGELQLLEMFFREEKKKGRSFADLYELVQHAGNVLPRLYLLCTVGSCYIRGHEGAAKEVLKDLVEMCKGVQHPTRGLFLRAYLCQVCRGLLPETKAKAEGEQGDIRDSLDFLLLNFTEMNKLWVRMQHQGAQRDRDRREKERAQLADLVGKNLTYISQLEGLDYDLYVEVVHPRVMDQVVSCRDDIAQQYLMQAVIQGFPDDFHLGTLPSLLSAVGKLQPGVKIHTVLSSLLDRLARYAAENEEARQRFDSEKTVDKLLSAAQEVASQHSSMPPADLAAIFIALNRFSSAVYPGELGFLDSALRSCHQSLSGSDTAAQDAATEKQLVLLLSQPLEQYGVVTALGLTYYAQVLALLRPPTQKAMAMKIARTLLASDTPVDTVERTQALFLYISPIIQDLPGADEETDEDDYEDEQNLAARVMHRLQAEAVDDHFAILQAASKHVVAGANGPKCICDRLIFPAASKHVMAGGNRRTRTAPALVFAALQTVRRIQSGAEASVSPQTVLQFINTMTSELSETRGAADMALQLFLTAAEAACEVQGLDDLAYELFEQALLLYEEAIPDTAQQRVALAAMTGALQRARLPAESRAALVAKATAYAARLLRRADQCRAVLVCSHMHWQVSPPTAEAPEDTPGELAAESAPQPSAPQHEQPALVQDADEVMKCLKRALKWAHAAQQQAHAALKASDVEPVTLFVEILNLYAYYFDQGLKTITSNVLQNVIELVANHMEADSCQADAGLKAFHANTLHHIVLQQAKEGETGAKYKDIKV